MKKDDLTDIIENRFLSAIKDGSLLKPGDMVLAGISGGPDSVMLAALLGKFKEDLKISTVLIHVNHNLRARESLSDEAFTRDYASKLGLEFVLKSINPREYSKKMKLSLETASRVLRYKAFDEALCETGANIIATAHHLDDLVETMLFRIFKGAGVSSLLAMAPSSRNIIRPLLFFEKNDIMEWLAKNRVEYRSDMSNLDLQFDRNFIRNRIIPVIEERFPDFRMKMLGLYNIVHDEEEVWEELLKKLEPSKTMKSGRMIINKKNLDVGEKGSRAILKRFLHRELKNYSDYSFNPDTALIEKTLEFLSPVSGNKVIFNNGSLRIISSYDSLIIDKTVKKFPNKSKYVRIRGLVCFQYGDFRLTAEKISGKPAIESLNQPVKNSCVFNAEMLEGFTIRAKQDGDRFSLPGSGTKKIKDFFIDEKIGMEQREQSFIIEEKHGRIITFYIPGYGFRVSADFYVKPPARNAVRISVA
jgi:tRNA(Ile)-lysidine synthase